MPIVIKGNQLLERPKRLENEILFLGSESTGQSRLEVWKIFLPKGERINLENHDEEISCCQILSGCGFFNSNSISDVHVVFIPNNTKAIFESNDALPLYFFCKTSFGH